VDQLFISERTACFHVTSIFNKLGADNRAQVVALVIQRGLLYSLRENWHFFQREKRQKM
jgi:ATP/maltotriose-dependent transcriptional regulator MalT